MNRPRLPRGFNAWVTASVGSELGSGVLAFSLTWVASAHGPQVASWVLTLTVAPAVVLGLLGGAVADRFGSRRVMIGGTLALMILSGGLAAAVTLWGTPPALLMVTAALIGTVAAFHRPAVGIFPRLFIADSSILGVAMARAGMASQLARTIAPPLGGLLIGMIALNGVALIDVLGCIAMLITLVVIHPPLVQTPVAEAVTLRGILGGINAARTARGVPALLLCVAIVAGAAIPTVLLGIPLAARERGWSASEAGVIEAGWIAGGLLSGARFAWRGTASQAWRPMAAGPLIVALGLGLLAISPHWTVAVASTTIIGIGVVVFTAHVFPTYLLLAPPTMLSRFQSLLILVQQSPQLIVSPVIGLTVPAVGISPVIAASGVISLLASLVVVTDRTLRTSATDAADTTDL